MTGGNAAATGEAGAQYSLRIVWSLARWVEDTHGRAALAELAAIGGVTVEDFDGTTCWIHRAQFEAMLAEGRRLAGSDEAYCNALLHRFKEGYGAFRHMVWAISLERQCRLSVAVANKVLMRGARMEIVDVTRSSFHFRYFAPSDSEALCHSRRVVWAHVPVLHGLPPGKVTELKCICRGDDCCEYVFTWTDVRVIRWVTIGLVLGLVAGLFAQRHEPRFLVPAALALLGAGAGYARELRRLTRMSIDQAQAAVTELRALGLAEAETRSEIVALQQRQHAWSARMEEEATDRDATLEHIVKGLEGLQRTRATSIRGFSHDLRNPLFVVRANARLLRESIDRGEEAEMLDDIEGAAKQIDELLGRLMDVATADHVVTKLTPQEVEIPPLVDVLRRRLRALVHGRGIDIIVEATSDVPESILVDRLVFDRVIDNLLTNAAKYTDGGTIQLMLRGGREGLVFELADTGRGIEKSRIAEIFRPRAAGGPRDPNSYGVGLSSAVRLLDQIGGGLEVTSVVGQGSTFRARFPRRPPTQQPETGIEDDRVIANVVTVRSAAPRECLGDDSQP